MEGIPIITYTREEAERSGIYMRGADLAKRAEFDYGLNNVELALKQDIYNAINQYRNAYELPPYQPGELITMAVACIPRTTPQIWKRQVLQWICDTFRYYKEEAARMFVFLASREHTSCERYNVQELVDGLDAAFDDLDVPIRHGPDKVLTVNQYTALREPLYVDTSAARIYLSNVVEPTRDWAFPFLQLPAELRSTIYEMVFSYHKTGITIRCRGDGDKVPSTQLSFHVLGREIDDFCPESRSWTAMGGHNPWENTLALPYARIDYTRQGAFTRQTLFVLLSVNKQIYNETMPTF